MSNWGPEDEAKHPRGDDGRWVDRTAWAGKLLDSLGFLGGTPDTTPEMVGKTEHEKVLARIPGEDQALTRREPHLRGAKKVRAGILFAHPEWWPHLQIYGQLPGDWRGPGGWHDLAEITVSNYRHTGPGQRLVLRRGGGVWVNPMLVTTGENDPVFVRARRVAHNVP